MKRGETIKVAAISVVAVCAFVLIASMLLAGFVMTGRRKSLEGAFEWQSEHYDTSFYEPLQKSDYTVEGAEGYVLHVQELANPEPSTKYVIISHGYMDNRNGALKYVPTYLDLGYNCVIYDLRGHGLNERTFTTYGVLEGQDLAALVTDVRARHADLTELGLHGESLGAGSTITSLKYKPEVDFAVADCGFSDIMNVLRGAYGRFGAGFLVDLANLGAKLRFGYALSDMRPIDSLDDNTIPVLFIHGASDSFILPKNSQDMYERTRGRKEICLIDGAEHARSVLTDPVAYEQAIADFLGHL